MILKGTRYEATLKEFVLDADLRGRIDSSLIKGCKEDLVKITIEDMQK